MNLQGIVSFPTDSELVKSCNKVKEKKGIFAVHSFQEPKRSIRNKWKKKSQSKKTLRYPKKQPTPLNCLGIRLQCTESNEMICDTTSDDSHSEKSSLKEVITNTLSTNLFSEGQKGDLIKPKDNYNSTARKNSLPSINFSVPGFFNDRTKNATSEMNLYQYSEVCKKYFYLEDRDLYLVTRERFNSACDVSKFDEDLFFSFDNSS